MLLPSTIEVISRVYIVLCDLALTFQVYEFMIKDQLIMFDFFTGLVQLTGIWKALGKTKVSKSRVSAEI